jgi:hypothetical protein
MYNEQQELLNEVYRYYLMEDAKILPNMSKEKMTELGYGLTQEEFINKCKTDSEFSEKWGLRIEERKLSNEEIAFEANNRGFNLKGMTISGKLLIDPKEVKEKNLPTKLITITYNDKTIESYE